MIAFDLEYVPEDSIEGSVAPPRRDLRNVYCEIMQMGAVKLDTKGQEIDTLDILIRPSFISHIPEWHVNLVGITEQDRKNGKSFEEGLDELLTFIGDDKDVWVFYGDYWVIPNALKKHNINIQIPQFKQLRPELERLGVSQQNFDDANLEFCSGNLHKVLNVPLPENGSAHNALHDARSLAYSIHKLRTRASL